MAARLALMRAQRQLYEDAGVHIHVKNFSVINQARFANRTFRDTTLSTVSNTRCTLRSWQVGAASLNATLNCEDFATAHSSTAHFDIKSFVGLAWRPAGEQICCGALQTLTVTDPRNSHQCWDMSAEVYSTGRAKCAAASRRTPRQHTHAALACAVFPGASSSGSCTSPSRGCFPSCYASARHHACSS